jgi:hypothetical protein
MPRRQSDNDLVKGAGETGPLILKDYFRSFPHPKGSTSAATWHAGVEDVARTRRNRVRAGDGNRIPTGGLTMSATSATFRREALDFRERNRDRQSVEVVDE